MVALFALILLLSVPNGSTALDIIDSNKLAFINENRTDRLIREETVPGDNFLTNVLDKVNKLIWPKKNESLIRKENSRFLNLFSLVNIPNLSCQSTTKPLRELNGTCYHPYECQKKGGIGMGECANGLGVCCFFQITCGAQINQEVAYFENPNYPMPFSEVLDCSVTISLIPNVEQILLEFIKLELRPPLNGDCNEDRLLISGQSINHIVPIICGINNGQHMFIDVSTSEDRQLLLNIQSLIPDNRLFSIRITQLMANLAPQGCLQYFTEPTGVLQSFNYEIIFSPVSIRRPQYFNNLNYAICIKRSPGFCTISFKNEKNGEEQEFQILNVDEDGQSIIPPRQAGAEIYNCPDDFVIINGMRLCGERLNDGSRSEDFSLNFPVTDFTSGPISVQFRTNGAVAGRGFSLTYTQNLC